MYGWRLRHDASDTDTDISGSGNMTDLHYFFPFSWWVQVWTLEPKHDPTFCRIHFPQQQQVAFVSEQGMFCRKMRTVWICPVSNLKLPEEKLLRNLTKSIVPEVKTLTSNLYFWLPRLVRCFCQKLSGLMMCAVWMALPKWSWSTCKWELKMDWKWMLYDQVTGC